MIIRNKNEIGKEFEIDLEDYFKFDNVVRSKTSGASNRGMKLDLRSRRFAIEGEATANKSYSLKADFYWEVKEKTSGGRISLNCIRFKNENPRKTIDLVCVSLLDFVGLIQELDALKSEKA